MLFRTCDFANWLASIRDREARARVQIRLDRLELGLAGDVKPCRRGRIRVADFAWTGLSGSFHA